MMRKLPLYVLIAGVGALPAAHAQGLAGLEMDVMGAGESPGEATARIALPGPGTAVREDTPEDAASVADQSQRAGESAALETGGHTGPEIATDPMETDAPAAPDAPMGTVDGGQDFGVGEPTSVHDGGGGVAEEPVDPGVIDGGPGDIGIIEPGGGGDLPVDGPPLGEPPVEEPPVSEPPVDEPPTAEVPIGEDGGVVPGDEGGTDAGGGGSGDGGGGDEVSIQPLPVETSDGLLRGAIEVK